MNTSAIKELMSLNACNVLVYEIETKIVFFKNHSHARNQGKYAGVIINWSYPDATYDEHFCKFLREFLN
uniref:Uncharacterized protein n=1 Tax=Ditylenchus dipsaci TaxID=166011 RepID=A0A915DRI8_9BILA